MKPFFRISVFAIALLAVVSSCQKAPFITLNGSKDYTFSDQGGSQTLSFSCNREWSVSSSASWVRVSPSSGTVSDGGEVNVTITCEANTTYDPRNTTLTIRVEELTETIRIEQATNLGLFASPTSFDLTYDEQTIEIEVQANVKYAIEIDAASQSWISQVTTKALSTDKLVFSVAENKTDDRREGKIVIKQLDGSLLHSIVVRQDVFDVCKLMDDEAFRQFCIMSYDLNHNDILSYVEALSVSEMGISCKKLVSLKGIECFINLQKLDCAGNLLTTLDMSNNTALISLICDYNSLTSLILSNNPELKSLVCSNNQLSSLDVSNCPKLSFLECGFNQLTSLNVSNNAELLGINCYYNQLKSLCSNSPKLISLYCQHNQLQSLDLSFNIDLKELTCYDNQLKSLDISSNINLDWLDCYDNYLSSLDASNNPKLMALCCYNNHLSSLNISNNPELYWLYCSNNQLTSIYVLENPELVWLYCEKNLLTSLDVSKNLKLYQLYCSNNLLTSLDVSKNIKLDELYCYDNLLTSLDVSKNTMLRDFQYNPQQTGNITPIGWNK